MTNYAMKYKHPHDETHIIDKTFVTEEVLDDRGTILFMPGVCDRGPDGIMLDYKGGDLRSFVKVHGRPNFKRHGQAVYNAINWLRNGGSLTFMRVTAKNATYANIIVVAKVKETRTPALDEDGITPLYINDMTGERTTESSRIEKVLISPETPTIPGTPDIYSTDSEGNVVTDIDGNPIIAIPGTPEIPGTPAVYRDDTIEFVRADDIEYDVVLESKSLKNLRTKNRAEVMLYFNQLYNGTALPRDVEAVEADGGYVTYPLFIALMNGKGKYGNNYTFRMSPDLTSDKATKYRNYLFNLLENTADGFILADDVYTVSPWVDARNQYGGNDYLEDVIANTSKNIHVYMNEGYIDELQAKFSVGLGVGPESVDFLFGNEHAVAKLYPNMRISTAGVNLSAIEGIPLVNGDDGDFDKGYSVVGDEINERYADCYYGDINKVIFNKVKCPVSIMMDAGFSVEAKMALKDCCIRRDDCSFILDMGDQTTLRNCLDIRANVMGLIDTWRGRIESQTALVFDTYTQKYSRVSSTYVLAGLMPPRFDEFGNHRPIAGLNRGVVTGIRPNSIRPMIDEPDDKEEFYENRINYIEEYTQGLFYFATQLTTQYKMSQLSDYNNTLVLLDIKRDIEHIVNFWRYEFTDDEDIARFIADGTTVMSRHEHKCKSIELDVAQTEYQRHRKILQTYILVRFKDIVERHLIEIEVNR